MFVFVLSRMEETVRSLLQSQAVEAVDIMKAYKVRRQRAQCRG